ncbi:MAG: hypothetical protein ACRC3B_21230 [Bacteroidia bacterium]
MENPFIDKHNIFNAQFKLITEDNEFRMSHWVKGFGITDNNDEWILEMMRSFNLSKYEEVGNVLKINFMIYADRSKEYDVEIDPFKRVFVYKDEVFDLKEFENKFNEISAES